MKSPGISGIARGLLLALALAAVDATAITQAVAEEKVSVASRPVESNGVALVIGAAGNSFARDEPLELRVTFENTTDRAIWLLSAGWGYWVLHVQDEATGKTFTGVSTLPGGVSGLPQPPPVRLQPHERQTAVVTFRNFGFVTGNPGRDTARNELFRIGRERRPEAPGLARFPQLAPGVYQLAVEIRIPDDYRQAIAITLDNAALCRKEVTAVKDDDYVFHDDECRIRDLPEEFDAALLWKDDDLRSNPVEIKVAVPGNRHDKELGVRR